MRISAKGRYALAAMIHLGRYKEGECIPLIQIAETMDISKIYLEQVFSLLKRAGLVSSIKGSQGGYQLTRYSKDISIYDIMSTNLVEILIQTVQTSRIFARP